MRRIISIVISALMAFHFIVPVYAEEDYSDEDYWYERCSQAQVDQEGVNACVGFQEYQQNKWNDLKTQIEEYKNDLDSLNANTEKIEELGQKQKSLADALSSQVANMQAEIEAIQVQIEQLQIEVNEKQAEIDAWQLQIEDRMREEQASTGTNILIDLLMGASDLNDVFRRFNGIERITASDQDQIVKLNELKSELELKVQEQQRLSDEAQQQKQMLESETSMVQQLDDALAQLEEEYQKVAADLKQKLQEQATMTSEISSGMISSGANVSLSSVDGFIAPIQAGSYSAGTWAYPSGGLHLGLDWATSIGTPVYAPADGIIIYASFPVDSNCGYLGNWCGWPYGGGNTVEMLCQVNGVLYAVSFAHLAQSANVSAGQSVSQGQVIALTGNSGNSSGAHCHIEVYNLGSMSVEEAISQFSSGADFAWGTGWNTTATACESGYSTPCRERPEKFFG